MTPAPIPAGMPSGRPPVGAAVLGRFTKWGEGRHWEWVGRYPGADEFGHWWYAPVGTRCVRPGVDLDVVLTPEGHLFVDVEDEFAEHQVSLGYPPGRHTHSVGTPGLGGRGRALGCAHV